MKAIRDSILRYLRIKNGHPGSAKTKKLTHENQTALSETAAN